MLLLSLLLVDVAVAVAVAASRTNFLMSNLPVKRSCLVNDVRAARWES